MSKTSAGIILAEDRRIIGSPLKSHLENRIMVADLRLNLKFYAPRDPVLYMWWFKTQSMYLLLGKLSDDIDWSLIEHDTIRGNDYCALYVGIGKSCRQRFGWHIRQHHTLKTVEHGFLSTLRFTLSALLGIYATESEQAVSDFMNENCCLDWTCYPGCTREKLCEMEEQRIQNGYFPLNIQSNHKVSPTALEKLKMMRALVRR